MYSYNGALVNDSHTDIYVLMRTEKTEKKESVVLLHEVLRVTSSKLPKDSIYGYEWEDALASAP